MRLSAMVGMLSVPGLAPLTPPKLVIIALSQTLAAELAGTSIGVSVLLPGFMRTRAADSARNRPKRFGERTERSQEDRDQVAALVRSGMDPDEVAEKVMHGIKENRTVYLFTPGVAEHTRRALSANTSRLPSSLSPTADFFDIIRTQKRS